MQANPMEQPGFVEELDQGTWRIEPEAYRKLMRINRQTIREAAQRTGLTMKRIRQWRNQGVTGKAVLTDEAIDAAIGSWPTRLQRYALAKRLTTTNPPVPISGRHGGSVRVLRRRS